jgi:hypothetical protein
MVPIWQLVLAAYFGGLFVLILDHLLIHTVTRKHWTGSVLVRRTTYVYYPYKFFKIAGGILLYPLWIVVDAVRLLLPATNKAPRGSC